MFSRYLTQNTFAVAKAECSALCDTITATLPREIRDLIYTLLFNEYDPLPVSNMIYDETKDALLPSSEPNLNT
jgi:hypothetical protein